MTTVLFVITGLERAGAETALLQLISQLQSASIRCACIALRDGPCRENLETMQIPTFVMERRFLGIRWYRVLGALRFAKGMAPHVVQGWMYHGNLFALFLRRVMLRHVPLYWGIRHGLSTLSQERWTTALAIRLCARLSGMVDAILYNSFRSAERHEQLGFRTERTRVILNGVDTELFAPDLKKRAAIREQLRVRDDQLLVGVIARNHPDKDPMNFLRAVALLARRLPMLRAVMVGKGYDALKDTVLSQRLVSRSILTYIDATSDVLSILQGLDLLVCPSRNESFPNVVAESMSCAIPCVVTDVGDAALLVGESGRVVAPGDSEALAAAIEEFAKSPDEQHRRMQAEARARVVKYFSIERMKEKYIALYAGNAASIADEGSFDGTVQGEVA